MTPGRIDTKNSKYISVVNVGAKVNNNYIFIYILKDVQVHIAAA